MNIHKNKITFFLIFNFLLLMASGYSATGTTNNSILEKIVGFSEGLTKLVADEKVVFAIMFIAILFGTFSLYKALLRFAFSRSHQFKNKEINVIAFMVSIISTIGIFFIFNKSPKLFIILFGGSAGLLLISFIVFFIMFFFYNTAESIKKENGLMGKGVGWFFIIVLGLLLSSYLLLGYSGKVITELNCGVDTVGNMLDKVRDLDCTKPGAGFFTELGSITGTILEWALTAAFILGPLWFFSRKKEGEEESEPEKKDIGALGKFFGADKERSDDEKSEIKQLQNVTKRMVENFKNLDKNVKDQEKILNNLDKLLRDQIGGNN